MNPSDSESAGINEASTAFSELLEAMIAARQLTAADARSFLAQKPADEPITEERVLRWLAGEYGVGFAVFDEPKDGGSPGASPCSRIGVSGDGTDE